MQEKLCSRSDLLHRRGFSQLHQRRIDWIHRFPMCISSHDSTQNTVAKYVQFSANTGGLLGLFMGFSVLSLIEIFYFITLRPYCKSIQHHQSKTNTKSIARHSPHETGITHSNCLAWFSLPGNGRNDFDQQDRRNKIDSTRGKLHRNDAHMQIHQRNNWINHPYMN